MLNYYPGQYVHDPNPKIPVDEVTHRIIHEGAQVGGFVRPDAVAVAPDDILQIRKIVRAQAGTYAAHIITGAGNKLPGTEVLDAEAESPADVRKKMIVGPLAQTLLTYAKTEGMAIQTFIPNNVDPETDIKVSAPQPPVFETVPIDAPNVDARRRHVARRALKPVGHLVATALRRSAHIS